jgi:molybdate transport system permease protein
VSAERTAGPPRTLLVPAAAAVALLALPLAGLVQRASWRSLPAQLSSDAVLTALRLSAECSLLALGISLLLGVPLATVLARVPFRGAGVLRALITLPLVLPPVVGGVALLDSFGRTAPAGRLLGDIGITLPFTTAGAVLAETFVAMPFLVLTVEAGLRQGGTLYEEAAATLGAGRWRRFLHITLPLAAPSLLAGAALCWARALGEFGATITFAGSYPGTTQTMPLAVYQTLEAGDPDTAVALSMVLLATSLIVLLALRDRWPARRG